MGNLKKSAFKSALDFEARQLAVSLEIIAQQQKLLAIVRTALPDEIAVHVQHCVHSGKRLLVYTEAACWASQIRFYSEAILNKIIATGQLNITTLQIKITQQFDQQFQQRYARLPSADNISLLRNRLKTNEDDILAQALIRLAKTLEKRIKT